MYDRSHLGHAQLFPADAPVPLVSTVNFRAGGTRGNNAVASLGTDGKVAVRAVMGSAGSAHAVIDVFGYFK